MAAFWETRSIAEVFEVINAGHWRETQAVRRAIMTAHSAVAIYYQSQNDRKLKPLSAYLGEPPKPVDPKKAARAEEVRMKIFAIEHNARVAAGLET